MPSSPITDPLSFWSRVLVRLGLVLGLVAVAPAIIDFIFFGGAAIVIATIALYALAPLAVACLLFGIPLWVWSKLRK